MSSLTRYSQGWDKLNQGTGMIAEWIFNEADGTKTFDSKTGTGS